MINKSVILVTRCTYVFSLKKAYSKSRLYVFFARVKYTFLGETPAWQLQMRASNILEVC